MSHYIVGEEDQIDILRRQYREVRNSTAVANLPPGSASDADVKLALAGFPPDGASVQVLLQYLRGMRKISILAAQYNEFKADYISANRTTLGINSAWQQYNANKEESKALSVGDTKTIDFSTLSAQ